MLKDNKNKIQILSLLSLFLFLFSFTFISSAELTTTSDTLSYDGMTVVPYSKNDTKLTDFEWVTDERTKEFYPDRTTKTTLSEFHYFVNKLETNRICTPINQFFTSCSFERLNFDKFLSKNEIDKQETTPIYFDNPLTKDEEPTLIGYLISFYGIITNLDPSFELTFDSTQYGFYNQTQATALGVNLSGTNSSGDYKSYVWYNSTETYWNTTLGHNSTLNLETRTATSYNLTDSGLVSFWSFNEDYTDEMGLNDGTNSGSTRGESYGVVGQGANFDGDDYVNIDTAVNDLASTTTGTWSAWVKPVDATPDSAGLFISFGDTDDDRFIQFLYRATSGKLRASLKKPEGFIWDLDTENPFSDNTWTHVAVVQNGIEPVLYVDGVKPSQTFVTSTDKTAWFADVTEMDNGRIGNRNDNSAGERFFFNGSIDEVKIYNRSLSADEVSELYNMGTKYILWNEWTDEGDVTSDVPITSTNNGKFFQWKADFSSSGYLFDYTITSAEQSSEPEPPQINISTVGFVYPNVNLSVPHVKLGEHLIFD